MRNNTPAFRDDADAEQHLIRHLRRMLLMGYYQETVSEQPLTEQHIADTFAHNAHFRRHLDLQGINPDTLITFTDEGRTMVSAIITGWVRMLRLPPDEIEHSSCKAPSSSSPAHHGGC